MQAELNPNLEETDRLYRNDGGKFSRVTADSGLEEKTGWWFSLKAADMDGYGDQDLVAGNLGLNAKYQAGEEAPFEVYANDMDGNGTLDIVLGYNADGKTFPVRGRECSSQQVPGILKDFPSYESFGNATILDVYGATLSSGNQTVRCFHWRVVGRRWTREFQTLVF